MADLLSLFPAGSSIDDDGTVVVGGCRAEDLAAEFGTPVLVVAEQALRARAREYVDELTAAGRTLAWCSRQFGVPVHRRTAGDGRGGLGSSCRWWGDLTAIKAGVDRGQIVHHGNAKSDEEIVLASCPGSGWSSWTTPTTWTGSRRLLREGRTQDVLVRVIPGVTADTHAHVLTGHEGSKFGLSPASGGAD